MSIIPKGYHVLLKDNNGNFVNYLDNKIKSLSWEWDRIGGCGGCNVGLQESWDSALAGSFAEDYEVNIYAPVLASTAELWYSGFIDRVSPKVSGKEEDISVSCLGYVNQLKRIIVRDQKYMTVAIDAIVKAIIDTYITSNTRITSTASDYEDAGFSCDSIYFNESAFDAIVKLADIAGKREWGVRADKSFFFKTRNDKTTRWFNLTEDFVDFKPEKDFNPIVTGLYLIGGEGYSQKFQITNRVTIREEILTNSSITTQSVGQQYARSYLKEKGVAKRSYSGTLIKRNLRLESTIPLGKVAMNLRIGIPNKYDNGTKYDSGAKYDGGTESYQIDSIKYTLRDDGIDIQLNVGPAISTIADELTKLEYLITAERNS